MRSAKKKGTDLQYHDPCVWDEEKQKRLESSLAKARQDDAEGRIMIGSTTELHNEVPLENFLAMREAVLENPY